MIRSILLGLDGSEYSQAAFQFALPWAKKAEALIVGLGIVDEPTIRESASTPLGMDFIKAKRDEQVLHRARVKVEQILESFSLTCAQEQVASKVLEEIGLPDEQILEEAQRYDLIVLGEKTFFQSATQEQADDTLSRVLASCPRPVVRVPLKASTGSTVMVAYDGSLQSARTLQMFQLTLLKPGMIVHVVSVGENGSEISRTADRARDFLSDRSVTVHCHAIVSSENPASVLMEQAEQLDAGLVVMGAYGKPSLREFFFGTVTKKMLAACATPLFLYG